MPKRKAKAKLWFTTEIVPTSRGQEPITVYACSLCGREFYNRGEGEQHVLAHR